MIGLLTEHQSFNDFNIIKTIIINRAKSELTLLNRILEVVGSNLDQYTIYIDCNFRCFLQALQVNINIVPRLGHNRFLPIYLSSIIL
jgi:hypothetical protein